MSDAREFREKRADLSQEEGEMLARYHGLVVGISKRLMRRLKLNVERDDLLAYGQLGLLEAWRRYEDDGRSSFSSYAYYRVRGAMLDGCRKEGWDTRDRKLRTRALLKLNDTLSAYQDAHQDAPEARTLSDSVDHISALVGEVLMVVMLEQSDFEALLVEEDPPQEHDLEQHAASDRLERALALLSPEERLVVRRYHYYDHSLSDIAADIKKSKSWCSRINARALERLREILCSEEFRDA